MQKIFFGMVNLRVLVFLNADCKTANKRLFERLISVPDGLSIDYSGLVSSLRFLFGSQSIVVFEVL